MLFFYVVVMFDGGWVLERCCVFCWSVLMMGRVFWLVVLVMMLSLWGVLLSYLFI